MQVFWNRTDKYNEVSFNTAGSAATMLCSGRKLLRTKKVGSRTIYVFRFETFQHFPRFESELNDIKLGIPKKQYFDTYRQLLDGRQSNLLAGITN